MSEIEISTASNAPENWPVELTPPDISAYRSGNTGVEYAHRFDSGIAGPQVLIVGIVHGNELCGAIALDRLLRADVRPRRGSLTLVFGNPQAYANFDPADPSASRYVDEDLNRVWDPAVLASGRHSTELDRARALRPLIDTSDLLLDLHSMQHDAQALILSGPARKGRDFAVAIGLPPLVVADAGHAAGRRLRDYDGFSVDGDPRNALLVECGQHWRRATADLANRVVDRFLQHTGLADAPDDGAGYASERRPVCIEITNAVMVRSETAYFAQKYTGLEVIAKAGTPFLYDGDEIVRTPHDDCVLVMPSRHLHPGLTAVRLGRFVDCGKPDGC